MAKGKHRRDGRSGGGGRVLESAPAVRHELSGGVLGHDPWTSGMDVSESLALGVDAVHACVTLLADAVSSAEWGEWRGTLQLPTSRIVRRPMASLTRREWTWLVTATLALYSACPVRLAGGLDSEGVPVSLVPLAPQRVSRQGGAWYIDGERVQDEVRVIRRTLFPATDQRTAAVLHLAREAFAAAAAAEEYLGDWWTAGGSPLVQLTTDQELTDGQAASLADRYVARRKLGPGSAPVVLGKGAKVEPVGADAATDGAMLAQDHLAASVARWFRVPPHLVNVPNLASSLTYGTTEGASTDLVRYTLDAYAAPIGDFLSELLPGDYLAGRQVRLDLRHLTRAEFESRTRGWESAIRAGWMDPEEVRAVEGLAPREVTPPPVPVTVPAPEEEVPA